MSNTKFGKNIDQIENRVGDATDDDFEPAVSAVLDKVAPRCVVCGKPDDGKLCAASIGPEGLDPHVMKRAAERCGVPMQHHKTTLCIADEVYMPHEMSESEEAAWSGGSHPSLQAGAQVPSQADKPTPEPSVSEPQQLTVTSVVMERDQLRVERDEWREKEIIARRLCNENYDWAKRVEEERDKAFNALREIRPWVSGGTAIGGGRGRDYGGAARTLKVIDAVLLPAGLQKETKGA